MAEYKTFNVHELYPEGYTFDWAAFEADPENYEFTKEDIAFLNAQELAEYENRVPMTSYEKQLLRKWVASGHSVTESPGSRYLPDRYPPQDFIETYRTDREIRKAVRGMSPVEKEAYLKSIIGWTDEDASEPAGPDPTGKSPNVSDSDAVDELRRQNACLWMFIAQEGCLQEAKDFLDESGDIPLLF